MNAREFYDAVVLMRKAQKDYKENRTAEAKVRADNLEAMIDKEIHRVNTLMRMREKMPNLDLRLMKER